MIRGGGKWRRKPPGSIRGAGKGRMRSRLMDERIEGCMGERGLVWCQTLWNWTQHQKHNQQSELFPTTKPSVEPECTGRTSPFNQNNGPSGKGFWI